MFENRSSRWLAVLVASALAVAACSDDSGGDAQSSEEDGGASTTTTEPSADSPDPDSTDVLATLAFSGGNVNLVVTAPDGDIVSDQFFDVGDDPSPSGALLAGDTVAPCGEGAEDPIEAYVYWPEGQAPSGEYTATVQVISGCDDGIDYTLDATVLGEDAGTDSGTITGRFENSPPITFEVP
jgi:hypothetical protein